jgi:HD-GYP domain-containing protein (c-di-GMP phosphodiesterase class II)
LAAPQPLEQSFPSGPALLEALRAHHPASAQNAERAALLSEQVARELGCDPETVEQARLVALYQDLGKLYVAPSVLDKRGPLNEEDRRVLRAIPERSAHLVEGDPELEHLGPAILAGRARFDGVGRPGDAWGETIPLVSRIVSACSAFVSITSRKPYREPRDHESAVRMLAEAPPGEFCPLTTRVLADAVRPRAVV